VKVRPFNGSLEDAQGIIQVDRETFDDCDYTPEYIVALEADPGQYAWVIEQDGRIVGFVSAFCTHSLALDRYEIDELAVLPTWQGQGLGTCLVGAALRGRTTCPGAQQARALIATRNEASQRAFAKNGFSPHREADLLLYEVSGRVPRPTPEAGPTVRRATVDNAPQVAALTSIDPARARDCISRSENTYLLAQHAGQILGCVELIEVRTLQYHGMWLESIAPQTADPALAGSLFSAAIEEAKRHPEIDLVGYAVPPQLEWLHAACVSQGYHKVESYQVHTGELSA
jgi:N-acetylglutamate synthase-like GNAT family acetyltransferase